MSAVLKHIELELEKEDIASRVVAAGKLTESDQRAYSDLVYYMADNVTLLFDDLSKGRANMFDMAMLHENTDTRFVLCRGILMSQAFKAHGVDLQNVQTDVTYEHCLEQRRQGNAVLIEMGRSDIFMDVMAEQDPQIVKRIRDYIAEKGDCEVVLDSGKEYYDAKGREQSTRLNQYLSETLSRVGYPSLTM